MSAARLKEYRVAVTSSPRGSGKGVHFLVEPDILVNALGAQSQNDLCVVSGNCDVDPPVRAR